MSIEKGKRYERKIAKILSEWSGIELVRTPDGAPEDLYADIWPKHTTEHFPLAVECKHVEGWSFDQIIQGTGQFYDWVKQAIDQAWAAQTTLNRWYFPVLIFTRNRFPDYVAVDVGALYDKAVDIREYVVNGPMDVEIGFGVNSIGFKFVVGVRYNPVREVQPYHRYHTFSVYELAIFLEKMPYDLIAESNAI